MLGLGQLREINAENTAVRVDRAGRAAATLLTERVEGSTVQRDGNGSPLSIEIPAEMMRPGPVWDDLVDDIGGINQGAANLFRFSSETSSFDRLSTTFRTPEGERVGGSAVEPGLIGAAHPAYDAIMSIEPFVGEVPVAGRLRMAYLTPVTAPDGSVTGIFAVDVGWVDDLDRINGEATDDAIALAVGLLAVLGTVGVVVMFLSFRPLHRLSGIAHSLGSAGNTDRPPTSLTSRRDEIGDLAKGLAKVAELRETLEHQAYTDALTNVANRAALIEELDRRFEAIESSDDGFALAILDLDGFKKVNDGLGHQAGDELLSTIAAALTTASGAGEFVARLGGDEFAILSAIGPRPVAGVDELIDRLHRCVSGDFETSSGEARVTASVGVVVIPDHGRTSADAMSHADLALYEVKRLRSSRSMVYEPHLSASFERQVHLTSQLRRALDDDELWVAYQPLYDNAGHVVAVEGLARWDHPVEGPIPPSEFIPIAESTGLIGELGAWVLAESCRQITEWAAAGIDVPIVSMNVSTIQLRRPDFVDQVAELLAAHPVARGRLCLELTESVLVPDATGWHKTVLDGLTALGVRLSIDDFGTGYSSLSYLHDLAVDQVKVDRSFIAAAVNDRRQSRLLRGIVSLGKDLGLNVVLEGVETVEAFGLVADLDYDVLQGFLLARPMRASEVCRSFGTIHPLFEDGPASASVAA